MELIAPKQPEIWEQGAGFIGMCEHIARCAAICYNSTPKTGGEAVEFVKRLIKMGHGRALEFGTVYLAYEGAIMPTESGNRELKHYVSYDDGGAYTTMNLRSYLHECGGMSDLGILERHWIDITPYHPKRVTIHYPAISRAIADEFRTHTTLSTLMQSTRYVDKGKDGSITFIEPLWITKLRDGGDSETVANFANVCANLELSYRALIECGRKRQEARDLLPLTVSTEMVQCGYVGYKDEGWENFLRLRTAKDAHPDARWMAKEVHRVINDWQTTLPLRDGVAQDKDNDN